MTSHDAVAAVTAVQKELFPGLSVLRAIASADLYEDVHEVLMNQINRAIVLLIEDQAPGIHFCDQLFTQIFALVDNIRDSHDRALHTLGGLPRQSYCLYLRNFDVDRSDFALTSENYGNRIGMLRRYQLGAEYVLGTIVETCRDLPVIGVHNLWSERDPAAKRRDSPVWRAQMLSLGPDTWKPTVQALIGSAHVIVLYVDSLSEGLRWEMDQIVSGGHAAKTLIVATRTVRDRRMPADGSSGIETALEMIDAENRQIDFDEALGDASRHFQDIAVCGETSVDAQQLTEAASAFLDRQQPGLGQLRPAVDISRSEFLMSNAVPSLLRSWAVSGIRHFEALLRYALMPECKHSRRLAAASAQAIVAYSVLTSDYRATSIGLAVYAAIEDLPGLRDQVRRIDGRKRSELSEENLRRSRHYAALAQDAGLSDSWFERARSFLAALPSS